MPKIKYVGTSHVREISKKDFTSIGLEHDAVTIDTREDPTAEVSQEVADWLTKNEKGDWKILSDDGEEKAVVEEEHSFSGPAPDLDAPPTTSGRKVKDSPQA